MFVSWLIEPVSMLIEMVVKSILAYVLTEEGQKQLDIILTKFGLPNIIPGDPVSDNASQSGKQTSGPAPQSGKPVSKPIA